ncbi:alpha/beta-hydrolase N-terminal domain-containing protein, partial [Nocardia elegans]|uniref:alpha/beta-hydrolase N-terminal domain-containing protein n=1 Tax=Nocardia elegans TaxID=300029 RepID=UPI002B4AEB2B
MLEKADTLTRLRARGVVVVRRTEDVIDLNYVGLVVATVFFALSVTPSLVPRDWLFQGLISGINAALGYGLGCLLEWLFRLWVRPRLKVPPAPTWVRYAVKTAVLLTAVLTAALMLVQSARWQREITALMDMEPTTTSGFLRTGLLSAAVCALVIGLARGLRWLVRWVTNQLVRWVKIPRRVALPIGV